MSKKLINMEEFSERLRDERKRLRMSQGDLAAAGGVAPQTVIAYEKGTRKPDVEFLSGAMAAGVDIMFLLSGKPAASRVAEEIDWTLLNEINEGIDLACRENNVQVKLGKRGELVRVLYSMFAAEQHVNPDALRRVLNLAA